MAKRRAEPLMCHVPVKRLLREPPPLPRAGERRPRAEPGREGPAAPKRTLEEAEAPPGKRLGHGASRQQPGDEGGGRRRRGETAEPQDAPTAEGCAGGRGRERAASAAEAVCPSSSELSEIASAGHGEKLPEPSPRTHRSRLCAPLHPLAKTGPSKTNTPLQNSLTSQQEEEFCQYNSFLYWRAPLPAVDLSDIQNLDEETPLNAKTPARTDTTETEMET